MSDILKIAGAVVLPNLGGIAGGFVTKKNIKPWYETLKHPSFRPPNWLFAPMWTALYSGMGYASYLVWKDGGGFSGDAKLPLIVYGSQLALNWAWSPIFFGQHNLKGGLIDIIALTATASTCGVLFYNINKVAGCIFIPYIAWLGFASLLNYSVYKLNTNNEDSKAIESSKQS
ncbi:translocator protein [Lucilia sericata]|uniref:translocator protein n=1 Tax=Lucilia sericata TaxID=13632 RepID=UPI0018A81200|nr:translocator protein [Lucilia sericata]